MPDDAELLRRFAREGSQEAFVELVRRYLALVYGTAARQLGPESHLAQDAAQAVFLALARKAGALVGHPALAGWLYTTAHHTAARLRRNEARRRIREGKAEQMSRDTAALGEEAASPWETLRPALDQALRGLSEADLAEARRGRVARC